MFKYYKLFKYKTTIYVYAWAVYYKDIAVIITPMSIVTSYMYCCFFIYFILDNIISNQIPSRVITLILPVKPS